MSKHNATRRVSIQYTEYADNMRGVKVIISEYVFTDVQTAQEMLMASDAGASTDSLVKMSMKRRLKVA